LRQSAPEKITQQLGEFYRSQAEAATIIPLENQQALLVGTKDRRTMLGLKELVRHLDRDTGGDATLRIIPLVHLGADEVVPLLTQIYANSGQSQVAAGPAPSNGGNQGSAQQTPKTPSAFPPVQVPRGGTNDDGGFTPGYSQSGAANSGVNGNSENATSANLVGQLPVQGTASNGAAVRFVADTRNNAVMIYSSYSMYKLVRDRIKILDVPQAQVVIEAAVAEVALGDDLSHGVEAFL